MIDIRELRIGNFTRDKLNKTPYEINARSLLFLAECEEINKEFPIEPIPLTEEILKKLGQFVCFYGDDKLYKIKEISVLVNGYDNNIIKVAGTIIKSIHHFQNIIFDLTGEELEITF